MNQTPPNYEKFLYLNPGKPIFDLSAMLCRFYFLNEPVIEFLNLLKIDFPKSPSVNSSKYHQKYMNRDLMDLPLSGNQSWWDCGIEEKYCFYSLKGCKIPNF